MNIRVFAMMGVGALMACAVPFVAAAQAGGVASAPSGVPANAAMTAAGAQASVSARVAAKSSSTTTASVSSQDELHATIMSALLSDPRTAQLPPAQLQAMVDALAAKAQAQGVTAADIAWQPIRPQTISQDTKQDVTQASEVGCQPGSWDLCAFSQAFGLSGNDYSIPVALFITAGLLFLIIRRLHRHHTTIAQASASPVPPSQGTPGQF